MPAECRLGMMIHGEIVAELNSQYMIVSYVDTTALH
jgi:hypothetical protein